MCELVKADKFKFPGTKKEKFCLICFESFPRRSTDELIRHYKNNHEYYNFEAIGYSARLFDAVQEVGLAVDPIIPGLASTVLGY